MTNSNAKDKIFSKPFNKITDFTFDEKVAAVFPDMIKRSVPGYSVLVSMIATLTEYHVQRGSRCYDLGCSLGAVTLAMRHNIPYDNCEIIAVDNAPAMIEDFQKILEKDDATIPVTALLEDVENVHIRNASVVVLNFTLQFIPPVKRQKLINGIFGGMRKDGILILSEKIRFNDEKENELQTRLHLDFKRYNGYSELEISQKRSALENILIPESMDTHLRRLKAAGFSTVYPWFQCFNFISIIAIK